MAAIETFGGKPPNEQDAYEKSKFFMQRASCRVRFCETDNQNKLNRTFNIEFCQNNLEIYQEVLEINENICYNMHILYYEVWLWL